MSLPAKCNQEFHKTYPAGAPTSDVELFDVFELARNVSEAMQWNTEERAPNTGNDRNKVKRKGESRTGPGPSQSSKTATGSKTGNVKRDHKDDSLESWGPEAKRRSHDIFNTRWLAPGRT